MFFFGVKKERDPWIARLRQSIAVRFRFPDVALCAGWQDDKGGASHKLWCLGEAGQEVNKKQNAKGFCQINPTD